MLTLILVLVFGSLGHAVGRLAPACMKQMSSEHNRRASCQCLQENLQKKVKPAEMALLADVYEGKAVAAVKLQKAEFGALAEMDASVAENCSKDPAWKLPGRSDAR